MTVYKSRSFNTVEDSNLGVTKTSKDHLKLFSEFNYYYLLPENIKPLFAKPYFYTFDGNVASYSMERVDGLDLGTLIAKDKISRTSLKTSVKKIIDFKEMCPKIEVNPLILSKNAHRLVIEKSEDRIKNYPELTPILNKIRNAFATYSKFRKTWYKSLSHGDLCFSNTLWLEDKKEIRFVDPRGCLDENSLYMDEYYDLAKLSHSVFGNYEGIIHGHPRKTQDLESIFLSYLEKKEVSFGLLRVYEASLFLSMIPLHSENEQHVEQFKKNCYGILKEIGF